MDSYEAIEGLIAVAFLLFYVITILFALLCWIIIFVAGWKMLVKAGEAGWKILIPFYNIWVAYELCINSNVLWFILTLIPGPSAVAYFVMCLAFAKAFGKGAGFGILIAFFPFVGLPILAFGPAEYTGDKF